MTEQRLYISKKNLGLLVRNLKGSCQEFIAPIRGQEEDILYADTKNSSAGLLNYAGNSVISPRAFLLPQTELLFNIKSVRESNFVPIEDKKKRIFYGVRPCDIKALGLMRKFFSGNFTDTFYQQKLDNSTFFCLACTRRCVDESFCDRIDAGPLARGGFDLQLIALSRGFLVEVGSGKGRQIIKENKKLFAPLTATFKLEARIALKGFKKSSGKIDYHRLADIMRKDKIKESVWNDIGQRCVLCSGCITLCPTCSCFGITDKLAGNIGARFRYCDGCPYGGFTRMAGENTPQLRHSDHIRRFFEHKFNVDVARYGRPSCVGCGRCILTCPGNINVHGFIQEALSV